MNMQALLKQAQKMQKELADTESQLNELTYEASLGGGVVKVVVKGSMEIERIELDDSIIDKDNKEDLQDMIRAALNSALEAATKDKENRMNAVTGGVKMPGGF